MVVRNDSQQPVVLRGCMHHCGQGDRRLDPVTVAAGSVSPSKQYGGVFALTEDLMWWEVKDTSGRELGCLGEPDRAVRSATVPSTSSAPTHAGCPPSASHWGIGRSDELTSARADAIVDTPAELPAVVSIVMQAQDFAA